VPTLNGPHPGVWPVRPEWLPQRTAWVEAYEREAKSFAACRFVEALGSGVVHPDVRAVQELHDSLSRSGSFMPTA
jgi:hypothetical protein